MSDAKILNHPDREEIVKKLLDGISPNDVRTWLIEKYPEDKQHHITVTSISGFRRNYLNLDQEAARILKKERKKKELGIIASNPNLGSFIDKPNEAQEEYYMRVKTTLLSSETYQERLKTIVDAQLDGPRLLKEIVALLQARLEKYYNDISSTNTVGEAIKSDRMFAEYARLVIDIVKDAKKIESDYNVQDEGLVNLDIVHQQMGLIRDTVGEMMGEIDADIALEFTDRLNKKLNSMKYESSKPPDVMERVEKITKRVKDMQDRAKQSNSDDGIIGG